MIVPVDNNAENTGLGGNENGIPVNEQNKKSILTIESVEHEETFTCEVNPTEDKQALKKVIVSVYSELTQLVSTIFKV